MIGEAIGDPQTVHRLAVDAGLQADQVGVLLAGDAYTQEVRDDETEARELGIRGSDQAYKHVKHRVQNDHARVISSSISLATSLW